MYYFTIGNRQRRMPVPKQNNTDGLAEALKNTTIGDQGLIDELQKIQTYSAPAMFCRFRNRTLITGVSTTISFCQFFLTSLSIRFKIKS